MGPDMVPPHVESAVVTEAGAEIDADAAGSLAPARKRGRRRLRKLIHPRTRMVTGAGARAQTRLQMWTR
eukprot:3248810-Alexandrium_andersonii.AAC.1